MTADLERRLRALRDELPEPPAGMDLSAVAADVHAPSADPEAGTADPGASATDPVIVVEPVSMPARRRRRTRWLVAATVAAALVVGVAVAAGIVRGGHQADPAPVAVTPLSTTRIDPATQVVRDGDRVEGTGDVVAVDGQPVRFCAPAAVALPGVDGPVDPYAACGRYLTVIGLDLAALGERTPFPASGPYPAGVDGRVHLVATLRGATLVDVTASPAPYGSDIPSELPDVPCAAPAGGWPTGPAEANVDVTAVTDYGTAHPGTIVNLASLRPSTTQVVTYVLTAGDPAPVVAALRPTYGEALCVVRSVYTSAQLAAGASAVGVDGPLWNVDGVYSSAPSDFGRDGQPQVTLELEMVTDAVLAAVPDLAPGLLQFRPWLTPVA